MKKAHKIYIAIAVVFVVVILAYYLAPLRAWLKGSSITIYPNYKQQVNVYIPLTYSKQTSSYSSFCLAWWQTRFMKGAEIKDPDFTYEGGVLDEVVITPSNN